MTDSTGYCFVSISPVRKDQADQSEMVSQLLFGEGVEILERSEPWFKIRSLEDAYEGYVDLKHIRILSEQELSQWQSERIHLIQREAKLNTGWGNQMICRGSYISKSREFIIGNDSFRLTSNEIVFENMLELAYDYLNTPYLWGGKSPYGIDCSGFTQIVLRCFGIELPRDASQQVKLGKLISFGDSLPSDLAFFENDSGKITHVGIIGIDNTIIHASGHVREDELTEDGIYRSDIGKITHRLNSIKRL